MKNKRIEGRTVLALLLVTTLSLTACKKKEVFQQELYNELLTEACPVDPIDASHRWTTTRRRMVTVYVNAGMGDLLKLQLLNDNPAVNSRAEIMAEQDAPQEGSYYTLVFAAPAAQTNFYAALTTADGRYAVVPFTVDDRQVDFSQKTELNNIGTPGYQTFTYSNHTTFRWPLEGHLIGTYKEGILTGAYRQPGHAFGEWAANSQQANDWYLYPTATEVY